MGRAPGWPMSFGPSRRPSFRIGGEASRRARRYGLFLRGRGNICDRQNFGGGRLSRQNGVAGAGGSGPEDARRNADMARRSAPGSPYGEYISWGYTDPVTNRGGIALKAESAAIYRVGNIGRYSHFPLICQVVRRGPKYRLSYTNSSSPRYIFLF